MSAGPNNNVATPQIDTQSSGGIGSFFSRHWLGLLISGVLLVTCGPLLAGFAALFAGLLKSGGDAVDGIDKILGPVVKVVTDFVTWCQDHEVWLVIIYFGCWFIQAFGPLFVTWLGNRIKNPKGSMGEEFDAASRLNSTSRTEELIKLTEKLNAAKREQRVKPAEVPIFEEMFGSFYTVNLETAAVNKTDPSAVAAQKDRIARIQVDIDGRIEELNENRAEGEKIDKDTYKLDPVGE
jgi:hypothetical protein